MTDRRLSLAHLWVAFAAFGVAITLGLWQAIERSPLTPWLDAPRFYFTSVTAHGVAMAYVLTTFFIMGFGYFVAETSLNQRVRGRGLAWLGFLSAIVGTLLILWAVVTGQASVLYTFYPPLQAPASFYVGFLLLLVGSWIWCVLMLVNLATWKRAHPGETVPLAMFATATNAILWLWTSIGVTAELLIVVLPVLFGFSASVDVGLSRTLFSWTLHAIVYFWLIPAYTAFYTLLPRAAGGPLFSDPMGRIAFIMFLIFSMPVGFHHLFMDPEHGDGWKLLHTFNTLLVVAPTFLTVFTITASMELAGRLRGGRGLFGWIRALPWDRPLVLATGLAAIMLGLGGFSGMINAGYGMNAMVHNTSWVPAHFHLIFGGATVIMYFAIAYEIWPKLTGHALTSLRAVRTQLMLWFVGMLTLSLPWHWLGLLGQPRRVSDFTYDTQLVTTWQPFELTMVIGGVLLFISGFLFLFNLVSIQRHRVAVPDPIMHYAEALHVGQKMPGLLNGFAFWNGLIALIMAIAYGYPIAKFFLHAVHGAAPYSWGG